MKKFFNLFLFFVNFLNAFGGVIEYKGKKLNISRKVLVLEDQTKSIKEEDVVKGLYDEKFKLNKDNLLYLGNNNSTYYIKFQVKNFSDKNRLSLYGWFSPLILKRTEISIITLDNKVSKNKFTTQINDQDRQGLLNYGHASFFVTNNEIKTIYIKTNSTITTPLVLTTLEDIIKEENLYLSITHIFNGLSLLILLIIFASYLRLRKNYLLYYVLLFLFTYLKSGLFLRFAGNYLNSNTYTLYSMMVVFYIFFLVNFVTDILNLNKGIKNIKIKNLSKFCKVYYFRNGLFIFIKCT